MLDFLKFYISMAKFWKKIKKDFGWSWVYLLVIFAVLFLGRYAPYLVHGPFGFGYDVGIYKHVFENTLSFSSVLNSEIYFFPAFLAYLFNLIGLSTDFLLYQAHILFGVIIAIPLYFLTKEYFGKTAALIAVPIFAISFVQIFASEFYLYKAVLGAIFMLLGFLLYTKKSYWFYPIAALLALTQLPQFMLLAVGVAGGAIVEWKKHWKFNLIGVLILVVSFLLVLIFTPHHIINAWELVRDAVLNVTAYDSHQSGLFMNIGQFFRKDGWIFVLGIVGLILSYKNSKAFPLQVGLLVVFREPIYCGDGFIANSICCICDF